ncbi:MAG: PAS domain S-box protein [Bacteroidia bacterium]
MSYHTLLQKQITDHLSEEILQNPSLKDFLSAINNSYYSFEKDQVKDSTVEQNETLQKKLAGLTNIQNAIFNETDYAIIYTDQNGIIKSFNKGAEKMLGYEAAEVIDITDLSAFHDQQEMVNMAVTLSAEFDCGINPDIDVVLFKAKANITDTNEWTYIRKDEQRLNIQLSMSVIKDPSNEIIGFLGIAYDISEQKKAQKALVESEERYRSIVEKSTDIIYRTNEGGFFIFANAVAERITGYSKEELSKKRYIELIREDKRKEALLFYVKQFNDRKTTTYYEFPIITKSGEERWLGQSVQLSELNNYSFEFTALAIDVTERIDFEKKILLQKEKYQNIITNMNLGLLEVDLEQNIQFSNPGFTALSGYNTEELIGQKASELFINEADLTLISNKIQQRLNGVADMYEVRAKNKQGELKWWMISGAPNYDYKGNLIGSIGIHLDITEKKKLAEALEIEKEKAEASSRAKEAFLATMSHEIRTPLNGIIGMIRELSYEPLLDKQKKYVHNASVASQHLLSVLNNVLDISKIEAGELSLEQEHFSLRDTIKNVKLIMATKAKEKGIFFGVDTNDIKHYAYVGDSARIRQVLLNLLGNALKFTSKGGVYVECKVLQINDISHTISISVEDTGIGMDESYQANVFKKFSQEDSSTSRKYGGTGLGMAITNEIIQLMNGKINVKSKKNEGTTIEVIFDLPIGEIEKIESYNESDILKDISSAKVLLVEDNEFNRASAINTLNRFNCDVTVATNGKEATEIVAANNFDVILMDLQMPIMDGFEATQFIRNDLKILTPIIALTANAFKSELEKCFSIGMNDCVTKPFEEDELLNAIYKFVKVTHEEVLFEKEIVKEEVPQTQLYDLQKLSNLVRNDKEQLHKMVQIFIDQADPSIEEILQAYKKKDLTSVYQVAHRIKPSIDGMGIISLKEVVRSVEKNAKENNDSEQLQEEINFLCSTLSNVVTQLNQDGV